MKLSRPKLPRARAPRLLPVVIMAIAALLVFKSIGLVTNGGYVLAGVGSATAADTAPTEGDAGAPSVENAAPRTEPTLSDIAPTLTDTAPTIQTAASGASSAGTAPAAPAAASTSDSAAPAGNTPAAAPPVPGLAASGCLGASAPAAGAAPGTAAAPAAPNAATADVTAASLSTGCTDAVPMKVDVNGNKIPLASTDGGSLTDDQVLQRLAERRAELDKREADLNAREAIVEAAEKQMQQRADDLKALEAQISALADEKKQAEDTQFAALVSMYETMKPQEAGPIFDGLDIAVLTRVAKAMNPKKMALVLAKMTPEKAQQLTQQLAAADTQIMATTGVTAADPNALPQIVGH